MAKYLAVDPAIVEMASGSGLTAYLPFSQGFGLKEVLGFRVVNWDSNSALIH